MPWRMIVEIGIGHPLFFASRVLRMNIVCIVFDTCIAYNMEYIEDVQVVAYPAYAECDSRYAWVVYTRKHNTALN